MDKKLLICGAGLVLAIAPFVHSGMKGIATNQSADNRTSPSKKDRPVAGQSTSVRRANLSSDDPRPGLLRKLNGLATSGEAFDREQFSSLLAKLVEVDPTAAAEFATSITAGPVREEALRRISQAWASKDPAKADKWAAELSDESERQSALADVCMQVSQSNAGEAIRIVEKHGLDARSGSVTENLVHQWAAQDFSAAAAWIKARPAGEKRDQLIMRLAFVQSAAQPAEAARLVVEEIPEGNVQTEAVISVIYQWARRDMAGAREWVGLFPESPLRARAESELSNIAAYQVPEQK